METTYPFKKAPRKHQLAIWLKSRDKATWALFPHMGTGKSKILIDTAAWLYDQKKINGLVVIAPKPVYRNWANYDNGVLVGEIPAHMPEHIAYRVAHWSAEPRKADTLAREALFDGGTGLYVLLVNIEALSRKVDDNKALDFLKRFLSARKCLMAVDESTVIKNPKALCTKAVQHAKPLAAYRRLLCGRPDPNGPLDLYSQCEFLDWRHLGFSSFYAFKARYAKLVPMTIRIPGQVDKEGNPKTRQFMKVDEYQNLGELRDKLDGFASIVKREDCDLPRVLPPQIRLIELGTKQRRAYESMRKIAVAEIERQIEGGDPQFSIANMVITQRLRLHQILCGFLVADDRTPVPFDEPNRRIADVCDVLQEVSDRAVIWATYKMSVKQIAEAIAKEFGPESVLKFYGDSPDSERAAVKRAFDPTHPEFDPTGPVQYVVANAAMARGVTCTAAATDVFFSYTNDSDIHEQSKMRIDRIGQTAPVLHIYQSAGDGTVDPMVLDDLTEKRNLSAIVTPSNWQKYL